VSIAVDDLVVGYGDGPVLEGISLRVEPGELVGLVGPNGAGKTTLVRTALGALDPAGGSVRLAGVAVDSLSSREASRRVAAVPQQSGLTFNFTVREVVEMGRHPHAPRLGSDPDPDAVDTAMRRTGVQDLAARDIDAISGGERQRVLLARALAQDTPALLVDEPTASLDVNHQVRTLELIAGLATDGRAILAAIHDLNLAARYCDRLVVLAGGTVEARGPPSAILEAETIEAAFDTPAVVTRDPITDAPVVTALPGGEGGQSEAVHVVGTGPEAASVVARLRRAGYEVSAGVVPEGGRVAATAEALDVTVTTAPPLGEVSDSTWREARRQADRAAATVGVTSPGLSGARNAEVLEVVRRFVLVAPEEPEPETPTEPSRVVSPEGVVEAVAGVLTEPLTQAVPGHGT
jgi:iron complex transport system ATP-binding protein